jgi:hypothetical protein
LDLKAGYADVSKIWRTSPGPKTVKKLHQDTLADFSRPIGDIGIFVEDTRSTAGVLKILYRRCVWCQRCAGCIRLQSASRDEGCERPPYGGTSEADAGGVAI